MRIISFTGTRQELDHSYDIFRRENRRTRVIESRMSSPEIADILAWFNYERDAVLIGNYRLLAHGWRIRGEAIVIFAPSVPDDQATRAQCLARVDRPYDADGRPYGAVRGYHTGGTVTGRYSSGPPDIYKNQPIRNIYKNMTPW